MAALVRLEEITPLAEPVVGDAHVESMRRVGEQEVQLLGVAALKSHAAPSGEAETFVAHAGRGLYADIAHVQTTPDVLVDQSDAEDGLGFRFHFDGIDFACARRSQRGYSKQGEYDAFHICNG